MLMTLCCCVAVQNWCSEPAGEGQRKTFLVRHLWKRIFWVSSRSWQLSYLQFGAFFDCSMKFVLHSEAARRDTDHDNVNNTQLWDVIVCRHCYLGNCWCYHETPYFRPNLCTSTKVKKSPSLSFQLSFSHSLLAFGRSQSTFTTANNHRS
jgi:hypothetical protein